MCRTTIRRRFTAAWGYPSYPPYYWPPPAGYGWAAAGLGFLAGAAIAGGWWDNGCNWGGGGVYVVTATTLSTISATGTTSTAATASGGDRINGGGRQNWQHNPEHRRGVNYGNNDLRQKYGRGPSAGAGGRQDFRGFDSGAIAKDLGSRGNGIAGNNLGNRGNGRNRATLGNAGNNLGNRGNGVGNAGNNLGNRGGNLGDRNGLGNRGAASRKTILGTFLWPRRRLRRRRQWRPHRTIQQPRQRLHGRKLLARWRRLWRPTQLGGARRWQL